MICIRGIKIPRNGSIMKFSLSTGIYKTDQHKKIVITLLLFLSPVIIGAVYVVWETLHQTSETGITKGIGEYFSYLYTEQKIFLVPFVCLASTIHLLFISINAKSLAYIKIDSDGFEYNLPILARDISNGFGASRKMVSWEEVSCVRVYQGKHSQINEIKGPPSSRLNSTKVEVCTRNCRVTINPYNWLQEGKSDHRLLVQEAVGLSNDAVTLALMQCPVMVAFSLFIRSKIVNT